MGGMVLETNMTEILTRIEEQNKLEKAEVSDCCVSTSNHWSTARTCMQVEATAYHVNTLPNKQ